MIPVVSLFCSKHSPLVYIYTVICRALKKDLTPSRQKGGKKRTGFPLCHHSSCVIVWIRNGLDLHAIFPLFPASHFISCFLLQFLFQSILSPPPRPRLSLSRFNPGLTAELICVSLPPWYSVYVCLFEAVCTCFSVLEPVPIEQWGHSTETGGRTHRMRGSSLPGKSPVLTLWRKSTTG